MASSHISTYKRRPARPSPPSLDDAFAANTSASDNREIKPRRKDPPSWIDRALSSRGSRTSIDATDVYKFPAATHSSNRRLRQKASQVLSPNVYRKKRVEAPANFVRERKSFFAEVDAFELEEETPPPKGKWIQVDENQNSVIPEGHVSRERPILQTVQEDSSGELLQDTPLHACSSKRDTLTQILQTPCVCQGLQVSEPTGSNRQLLQCFLSDRKDSQTDSCSMTKDSQRNDRSYRVVEFSSSMPRSRDDKHVDRDKPLSGHDIEQLNDGSKVHARSIKGEKENCNFDNETSIKKVFQGLRGLQLEASDEERTLSSVGVKKVQPPIQRDLPTDEADLLPASVALLDICGQTEPLPLSEAILHFSDLNTIKKIGEGTYGEAFGGNGLVFKIVPMDGDFRVNEAVQKTCAEMYSESLATLTLNRLRGKSDRKTVDQPNLCNTFIETKAVKMCRGLYCPELIQAWEDWDDERTSENDHPMIFPEKQLYMLFVLADGGKDLEKFVLSSYNEARSLLIQVTAALAVAEQDCEFEHRDLHWGNVLISRTAEDEIHYRLGGRNMYLRTSGIIVQIIDFTLSRVNAGKQVLYDDLSADPALFQGAKGDIQAETYRRMLRSTKGYWGKRCLKTNCDWIHYLIDVLLTKKTYPIAPQAKQALRALKKRVLCYDSAKSALEDEFFASLWVEEPE